MFFRVSDRLKMWANINIHRYIYYNYFCKKEMEMEKSFRLKMLSLTLHQIPGLLLKAMEMLR